MKVIRGINSQGVSYNKISGGGVRVKALDRAEARNVRAGHLGVNSEHWVERSAKECEGSEAALPGSLTMST